MKKERKYLFSNDTYKKILTSITDLEMENEELKKLLKECNEEADEYYTRLCDLHTDIRGRVNEQQKP